MSNSTKKKTEPREEDKIFEWHTQQEQILVRSNVSMCPCS